MQEIYHFLLLIDKYIHIFYKDSDLCVTPEPLEGRCPEHTYAHVNYSGQRSKDLI